ncbi:MAG: HAD-IIIA family hydrolase [Ignavibacteriae bacterium]|nr:HAD-IIIA family hydrolase [Ignavibacteriota bacterium]
MNKAIFLDRDGTLNKEVDFLTKIDRISIIKGAGQALKIFRELGFLNIVITNQSGIERGYLTEKQLTGIHRKFSEVLRHNSKTLIDDFIHCPYYKGGSMKKYKRENFFRKPNPGMIVKAAVKHNIDLSKSFLIGDSYRDMKSADTAGVKKILVLTGYGQEALLKCTKEKIRLDCVADSILEASKFIKKYLEY